MLEQLLNILGWNVRGLNDQDRRDTVHKTIASSSCQIVCLQETKLDSISSFDAAYIGGNQLKSFTKRHAIGTKEGILLLWDDSAAQITNDRPLLRGACCAKAAVRGAVACAWGLQSNPQL
jgi:exonuclease III